MSATGQAILERKLARAEARLLALETLIEERSRELYLANETLRSRSEELAALFESIPSPAFVLDAEGVVRRSNLAFAQLAGGERLNCAVGSFWPEGQAVIARCLAEAAAIQAETKWGVESLELPMLISLSRFRGGFVGVGVDLRERKRLEHELVQAQKLEVLGQLSAGMAHELNTPLQFVGDHLTFAHEEIQKLARQLANRDVEGLLAEADFLAEALPECLAEATQGVERMRAYVQAFKRLSHPGQVAIPVDFNSAVRTALEVARGETRRVAKVEFIAADLPPVLCIESEVHQVVLNLVVNAADAIESRWQGRGGSLVLRTSMTNGGVALSVEDDGGGMPPEVQGRIYEPFFTTKPAGRGTGQGLPLSLKLLARAGGQLSFVTRAGHGTRFTAEWPSRPPSSVSSGASDVEAHRLAG